MRIWGFLAASIAALPIAASGARADTIVATIGGPGVQSADRAAVANAAVLGRETFAAAPLGVGAFVTDYGTGGVVTGSYSAGLDIRAADYYGGAGGGGRYADALAGSAGYTVSFATHGVPGVNYFGFWLSALDAGNELAFLRAGVVVGSYTPADLRAAVGPCRDGNPYCGNPNARFLDGDLGEPYAFVNIVDTTGYFDAIAFFESPPVGNYESDNHTVGYCRDAVACIPGEPLGVPEPGTVLLLGGGLPGLGLLRRRATLRRCPPNPGSPPAR